ncbi:MAG: hypothetical protein LBE84_01375 [Planctomycetota bacterium]|jgi:signal transduction histidine kinase|nr:hypothetical protein [Planctomycetota bacterium]
MLKRVRFKDEEEKSREERLAHIGLMAAGLIHEIKTPLHAIQLNAQMLMEDAFRLPPDIRPKFERRSSRVHHEVQSLARMLDAFLSLARPTRIDPVPTDLNRFLRDLMEFVEPEMDAADIILESNLASDMYPVVMDKHQFTHVVLNLLRNAAESIEQLREKSDADIEGRIAVATAEDDAEISLIVQDNGIGVPPGDEEKIFEFFYTTKPKGTGLGLALVQSIIEEHRGKIRVDPTMDRGARFVVTLPRGRFLEFREENSQEKSAAAGKRI